MNLNIVELTPTYTAPKTTGVFIQWTVENPTDNISKVKVERSNSPEGPFDTLVDNINTFSFFDNVRGVPSEQEDETLEDVNFYSLHRNPYYRVTATTESGDDLSDTKPVLNSLPKRQALLRNKIHRDITTGFKFNGMPLAILKKKRWGIRCKECFDTLTKKVTDSKCKACFGTGFEGGYHDPVMVTGRISVKNVQTQLTQQGYSDVSQKQLTILNYPIVEPHDIVASVKDNIRYIVKHSTQTELKTVPVHQRLLLSELARDSIEYQYLIDTENSPKIY